MTLLAAGGMAGPVRPRDVVADRRLPTSSVFSRIAPASSLGNFRARGR